MSEQAFFNGVVAFWFVLAIIVFAVLFFIPAPYGRHMRRREGTVPDAWGWVVMELPAVIVFGGTFLMGAYRETVTALIFLLMWMAHYVQRTFVYPFLHRSSKKGMPWRVVTMGFLFNSLNGYMNGRYLFEFSRGYPDDWLKDWRFVAGGTLFVMGYAINRRADAALRRLRENRQGEYGIPCEGMYRWISCPNYLGEIMIWVGWAVATWSVVGWAFAVWTMANLVPRAWTHHKWYQEWFTDYPSDRKVLLPGIW